MSALHRLGNAVTTFVGGAGRAHEQADQFLDQLDNILDETLDGVRDLSAAAPARPTPRPVSPPASRPPTPPQQTPPIHAMPEHPPEPSSPLVPRQAPAPPPDPSPSTPGADPTPTPSLVGPIEDDEVAEPPGRPVADTAAADDASPPAGSPPEPTSPAEQQTPPHDEAVDLATSAPHIGRVRAAPPTVLAAGVAHRTAALLADGVAAGEYYVAAASQIGMSHAAQGTPRQDSYNFALTPAGRLVVAIADGMGSRAASQIGAEQFCADVAFAAATQPDTTPADYLRMAAERTAAIAKGVYAKEPFAVAFVAAVAVFDGFDCEIARVGDVSAYTINAAGAFSELFPYDDEEHVNVVGTSLPDAAAQPEVIQCAAAPRIVLVTDGLAMDLRRSGGVRAWLGRAWAGRPTAHAMSDALRYRRQGSHDDRTAVVVAAPTGE